MRRMLALAILVTVAAACGATGFGSTSPSPRTSPGPFTQAQLKFAVLDKVGKPAWCDPDFYPLERAGAEQASAVARYADIRADAATYAAIVAHEHLPAAGDLTDAQKLVLYRAWKLLQAFPLVQAGSGYSFQYRIQHAGVPRYLMIAGTVTTGGRVTVASRTPATPPNCPICLASWTMIATPSGPVRVTDVRVGMIVWSVDASGRRIAEPVLEIGSMAAPAGHSMVHLVLADGRELYVSPGHPTADGRVAGDLRTGEAYDGSAITLAELVPYTGDRTYDLLPAGPTGHYWANGILVGSTLATQPPGQRRTPR